MYEQDYISTHNLETCIIQSLQLSIYILYTLKYCQQFSYSIVLYCRNLPSTSLTNSFFNSQHNLGNSIVLYTPACKTQPKLQMYYPRKYQVTKQDSYMHGFLFTLAWDNTLLLISTPPPKSYMLELVVLLICTQCVISANQKPLSICHSLVIASGR